MKSARIPKYRNRKTVVDGITFDSAREAARWQELKLLERAGEIMGLQRQCSLALVPKVKLIGESRARPTVRLVVDFRFYDLKAAAVVYEDAKGFETPESRLKRHIAKALHGIDVVLV